MKKNKEQPVIRENSRVLIIQYRPVGDILLTSPIAEYLKTLYPQIKITFMIFSQYLPIIQHNPYIDDLILMDEIKVEDVSDFIDYMLNRYALIMKLRETQTALQVPNYEFSARIPVKDNLVIELMPQDKNLSSRNNLPILCGVEVFREIKSAEAGTIAHERQ